MYSKVKVVYAIIKKKTAGVEAYPSDRAHSLRTDSQNYIAYEVREEQKSFLKNSKDPRPAYFFTKFKYRSKKSGYLDYGLRLREALQDDPTSEKLLNLKEKLDTYEYKDDWEEYEDEKNNRKADKPRWYLQSQYRIIEKSKEKETPGTYERLESKKLRWFDSEDDDDEATVASGNFPEKSREEEDEDGASSSASTKSINENQSGNTDNEIKDDIETEGEVNKVITDFLGNVVECSEESKNIWSVYTEQ
ncbi:hypothetical protein Glove_457g86 [Diversispora epigaea]|uniref:Uncharacterized protein n=1 Tax=Diversispora epigaea TaxID=1348612 RepID=A0A397GQY8_9GLOM|nr:hypothetical protein Glove_457g86 [Diversispora epigaea]